METQNRITVLEQRLSIATFFYVILFILHQYAHGEVDRFWNTTGQLTALAVFGFIPLFGAFLLWTSFRRFGGILALGCLPAAALFMVTSRYFGGHGAMQPLPPAPIWQAIYSVTFFLAVGSALAGSYFAARFLRVLHTEKGSPKTP